MPLQETFAAGWTIVLRSATLRHGFSRSEGANTTHQSSPPPPPLVLLCLGFPFNAPSAAVQAKVFY